MKTAWPSGGLRWLVVVGALALAAPALAEEGAPDAGPDAGPAQPDLSARLDALEAQNRQLRADLDALKDDQAFQQQQLGQVLPFTGRVSGYVDFGFFAVQGDGSGIRTDLNHTHFPQYTDHVPDSWVFYGDPLATAINARGDPADTGESRAVTFDPIHSRGNPTFLVNAVNLALFAGIGEELTVTSIIDFLPRTRIISDPQGHELGDYLDVKLAYAEYRPVLPWEPLKLSLFAGKFDSVLGYEYRTQESPDRLAVTPSLICRYTCGHPLGVKARASLAGVTLNLAVTNGSSMSESFGFYSETDTNIFKTVSGRLSYRLPIGSGVEVGASGSYGAQDAQPYEDVLHWHYGFDLHADIADFDLSAEFVRGVAAGSTEPGGEQCGAAPCISYRGAYGLLGYRVNNLLEPYVRVDWRDALHQSGASFVYISKILRATGGVRLDLGTNVVIKAEYTFNHELDPLPQIPDDIFTSALVLKY